MYAYMLKTNEEFDLFEREIGRLIYEMLITTGYDPETGLYVNPANFNALEPYNDIKYGDNYPLYYKGAELFYLYEGLIQSVNPLFILRKLNELIGGNVSMTYGILNNSSSKKTPTISFLLPTDLIDTDDIIVSTQVDKLFNFIKVSGWFISNKEKMNILREYYYRYSLDPKFIYEITDQIYNNYSKIYHITTSEKVDKIIKYGLVTHKKTKENSYNYPDRTYFYLKIQNLTESSISNLLTKYTLDEIKKIYKIQNNKDIDDNIKEIPIKCTILAIKLNRSHVSQLYYGSTDYKFYDDPRALDAVFTLELISPDNISIYKELTINIDINTLKKESSGEDTDEEIFYKK